MISAAGLASDTCLASPRPDFAQLVFRLGLEVESGHVIEDEADITVDGRVVDTRSRDLPAIGTGVRTRVRDTACASITAVPTGVRNSPACGDVPRLSRPLTHEAAAIAESIRPARCFQYSQSALAARTASGVVAVWALAMLPSRAAAA